MEREQAETFMVTANNRERWLSEALGDNLEGVLYRTKYKDGWLYVQWDETDNEVDVIETSNIDGEVYDTISIEEFEHIKAVIT